MNEADGWLIGHLSDLGLANADGIGRAARPGRCRECGARVLRGLDDERCGGVATADAHEIGAIGEYVALQIGLITYSLRNSYSRGGKRIWNLDPRYNWDVKAGAEHPILAQHRCGMQIPPAAVTRMQAPSPARVLPADGSAPF